MFVFECFVGARISDLQALTKDNISEDGNYIEYIADKTIKENPRICRIPLSLKAKEILKRYDMPDGKLMPHISQQQYNDGIKELLKSLGISRKVIILDKHTMTKKSVPIYEVISSHNARKTFIASLKKQGMTIRLSHPCQDTSKARKPLGVIMRSMTNRKKPLLKISNRNTFASCH